jgi:ABC-2 type transport system ATP-binding protein
MKRRLNIGAPDGTSRPDHHGLTDVGIDPQSRSFILQAVKELAKAGYDLYTSHYIEEVEAVSSRFTL